MPVERELVTFTGSSDAAGRGTAALIIQEAYRSHLHRGLVKVCMPIKYLLLHLCCIRPCSRLYAGSCACCNSPTCAVVQRLCHGGDRPRCAGCAPVGCGGVFSCEG